MNGAGFVARVVREDLEQSAHGHRRAAGAEAVVNMYVWRTNSEKLIKELKDGLILVTFCLKTLNDTDVTFLTGSALDNLLMDFERRCSPRAGLNDDYERYAIGFS